MCLLIAKIQMVSKELKFKFSINLNSHSQTYLITTESSHIQRLKDNYKFREEHGPKTNRHEQLLEGCNTSNKSSSDTYLSEPQSKDLKSLVLLDKTKTSALFYEL